MTSVHCASENGILECVKLLLIVDNINVNSKTQQGYTHLLYTQYSNSSDQQAICNLLIEHCGIIAN